MIVTADPHVASRLTIRLALDKGVSLPVRSRSVIRLAAFPVRTIHRVSEMKALQNYWASFLANIAFALRRFYALNCYRQYITVSIAGQ
ncbi:hypothetical protein ACFO8Q_09745 [Effusibacillus consociatus]|uniref:Uncharacterized protein n=1 Tax=Effusibacillus consociatus TaxID=1117041 RepID=A0ABV9Q140_9BACL